MLLTGFLSVAITEKYFWPFRTGIGNTANKSTESSSAKLHLPPQICYIFMIISQKIIIIKLDPTKSVAKKLDGWITGSVGH